MAASTEYDRSYVHIATELIYLLIMGNHIGEMRGHHFIVSGRRARRVSTVDAVCSVALGLAMRRIASRLLMWLMGRYEVPCGLPIVVCNGGEVEV
jgi:hypothetical protein